MKINIGFLWQKRGRFYGRYVLGVCIVLCASLSCSKRDDAPATPEEAVRALARAAHPKAPAHERERFYDLIGPTTRARLEQSARLASQQAGHSRSFTWKEMILFGLAHPAHEPQEFRRVSMTNEQARVEVIAKDGTREVVEVVKEGGIWKVELPEPREITPQSNPSTTPSGAQRRSEGDAR